MERNRDLYNRLQVGFGTLFGAMAAVRSQSGEAPPDPPAIFRLRAGYAESPGWFMVQAAEFDPEPLTVEKLRVRDIYASETIVQTLMELLASETWFDRIGDAYHLTEAGRNMMIHVKTRAWEPLTKVNDRLNMDVARLENLMGRTIQASLEQGAVDTWCLAHSRNRAPDDEAAPVVKIYQYLSDYNAFRDDAHMAAWAGHDISGHTWEAFSFVGDGEAASADDLFEKLHYRGYTRAEFATALDDLVQRGWLEGDFAVTEKGKAVRAEAERLTDEYFYGPWACLSAAEYDELLQLLDELDADLNTIATGEKNE